MNHKEMTRYLKIITIVLGVLLLAFVIFYMPTSLFARLKLIGGPNVYLIIFFLAVELSIIPCLLALYQFWCICKRIESENSFCMENAQSLKKMSQLMLLDLFLFIGVGMLYFTLPLPTITEIFGVALLLIIPVCIILSIICAALSHLVQKASVLQEEHDYTV